jgi:hypothetical protein
VVNVPVEGSPNAGDVSAMISAAIPLKRKRIPKQYFDAPAAAAAPPAVTPPAVTTAADKKGRVKTKAVRPRGAPQSRVKTKAASRISLAPPPPSKATAPSPSVPSAPTPAPPPPFMDVNKVFDVESTTSYMDMLNDSSVDLAAGINAFDWEGNVDDEKEEKGEGDERVDDEVVEVDPASAGSSGSKPRTSNYTEIEDATLVRAWSRVGMDACTEVDQGGKRYWQRIEDLYHQLKPRTKGMADRSYRSLEGRWNIIKPACSH